MAAVVIDHLTLNGGAVLGPTLFHQYILPHLAAPQDRRVGKVVAEASR